MAGEPLREHPLDQVELRLQQRAVCPHLRTHAVGRAEEPGVPQLVDLVGTDRLHAGVQAVPRDVRRRGTEEGHAGSRHGDLRGGGEHQWPVGVASGRGDPEDVERLRFGIGEVMHRVCVVPEDAKIGCGGWQRCEDLRLLDGHGLSARVRVHGHQPHATYRRVFQVRADGLEVEATILQVRERNHPDAHGFGDRKVPVIAGDGAQKADLLIAPRHRGARNAVQQRVDDDVVHDVQAGVSQRQKLRNRDSEQFAEDGTQLREAVGTAVVAHVRALRGGVVMRERQVEQGIRQVELRRRRLAAGEIQLEIARLQGRVRGLEFRQRRRRSGADGHDFQGTRSGRSAGRGSACESAAQPVDPRL